MLPERVRVCIHLQIFAHFASAQSGNHACEGLCVRVCVVMAAQTVDRGTVVCCFAEMMMPPSIQ